MGRPSKYKKEFCDQLIKHMKEGLCFESFGGIVGVSKDTLYEWLGRYPEFAYARKKGETSLLLYFQKLGRSAELGKVPGFNATVYIWRTRNMIHWRDKQEITIDASDAAKKVFAFDLTKKPE